MNNSSKSNILITGGAGFIGSHLSDYLLDKGFKVRVLDNMSNGSLDNLANALQHPDFQLMEGDILNKAMCNTALKDIDYVFHLACLGVRHSIHSPFENHRVNAEGTLNMLEAAKESGNKHFFYISTSEIYGRTDSFPITENASTNPLTVYGASKLAGEHYTRAFYECYQMPVTILRIFNNYGPRAHFEGDAGEIIPRSIVKILYGEQPMIFGTGEITRDFFYVKDTAKALHQFLEIALDKAEKINNQTFNIGTGIEFQMKYLIENLLKVMDKTDLGIRYLPDRPADVPRLWVGADKFRQATGFTADYTFEQGLNETVTYYENLKKTRHLLTHLKETNWVK